MEQILVDLLAKFPWGIAVLSALGSLVVIGQVVVALTPSKKDDEFLAGLHSGVFGKLLAILAAFAPIHKK
jgi:hypothetical protein